MISSIISRLVILLFGTLYPAYASYKAVKTKNVKEYVKWMMYWIVFALFTCAETFTDVFLSWFPFYYEIKIILVIWLLSPATKGSSILYRKFVHPMLSKRENEIDEYIAKAKEQSYKQVLGLGSKGVNALMQTALKNLTVPATLVSSLSDSSKSDEHDSVPKSKPSLDNVVEEIEFYSDLEMEPEVVVPVTKPTKISKSKGRPAIRKSARKQPKTEICEFSD